MKNKILLISFLSLAFVLVGNSYAAGQSGAGQGQQGSSGVHEPGTGLENPELKAENQGTGAGTHFATRLATQPFWCHLLWLDRPGNGRGLCFAGSAGHSRRHLAGARLSVRRRGD